MKWSEISFNPTAKVLRQFAAGWLVFFLAIGAHQYFARGRYTPGLAFMMLAVAVSVPGLIKPSAIHWLFVGWMVLAFPIGWLISQLMLALMFYGLITPVAVLFRIRGRDMLCRKPAPDRTSFWTPKPTPQDIRSYFRQY